MAVDLSFKEQITVIPSFEATAVNVHAPFRDEVVPAGMPFGK